jgi:dolichol-phosphate mannosyltransferase
MILSAVDNSTESDAQSAADGARRLLSIILPAFNEQEVLPKTYARFTAMADRFAAAGFDYELIFVNDGSRDRTPELLDGYARQDRHIRAVHLTRNFGHQAAVSAGLTLARGDVVAVMDCDLQDPPEILPQFLAKWREGYQVVYAVRQKRKEWLGKRFAYWAFYRLLAIVSDLQIPLDSGDFCLMDRHAVDLLNSLPERQRFVRGLRTWVGLRQTGIAYERDARQAGRPAYTFRALVKLAMDGLVSFSSVPLRLVTRLGILTVCAAILIGLWVLGVTVYDWIHPLHVRPPRGWASLACLVLLMSAVQMISLGIIGEYLARIFLEVKGRPTFLIASVVGGEEAPHPKPMPREDAQAGASGAKRRGPAEPPLVVSGMAGMTLGEPNLSPAAELRE